MLEEKTIILLVFARSYLKIRIQSRHITQMVLLSTRKKKWQVKIFVSSFF